MRTSDNENAELPDFYFKYFDSEEELFSYTSAETYSYPDGNEPVCYGFNLVKNDNAWNLTIYINDQSDFGGQGSVGIPSTQKPAYNPL